MTIEVMEEVLSSNMLTLEYINSMLLVVIAQDHLDTMVDSSRSKSVGTRGLTHTTVIVARCKVISWKGA